MQSCGGRGLYCGGLCISETMYLKVKNFTLILFLCLVFPDQLYRAAIVINEVNVNTAGTEPDGEYIEIWNTGTNSVDISGYGLSDGEGTNWLVPTGTILAGNCGLWYNI